MTKYKSNTYFHCFFHVFVSVGMKFGSVKHCYDDLLLMGQISAIAFTYLNRVNGFLLVTKSSSFNAKMRKTLFSILKITLRTCTNLFLGSLFAVKRLMLTPSLTLATNRASSLAFFGFVIFLTFLRASLSDSLSDEAFFLEVDFFEGGIVDDDVDFNVFRIKDVLFTGFN